MTFEFPYFMTNKEWYENDPENGGYVLTDKAPKKAIDSFIEYYSVIAGEDEARRRAEKQDAMRIMGIE